MPVPTVITDLSTTAASNSPAGSDPPGPDGDNYFRAHAAFIAQLYAGKTSVAAGMLKSDGSAIAVGVAGTDYLAPDALLNSLAAQTVAANKIQAYSGADTASLLDFKDEDDMASNSATAVPSQQSVKAYVDAVHLPVVMTTQASTSGSTIDFTGIPSWATQITISFYNVSLSSAGTNYLVQLGTGSGIENTTYDSSSEYGGTGTTSTSGFVMRNGSSDSSVGSMVLTSLGSNRWVESGWLRPTNGAGSGGVSVGSKTLSGTLDRVRIANTGGDTFDNGYIGVRYS